MATLEELKRENKKLKAELETKKDFAKLDSKRKVLWKENDKMKHPLKYAILKKTKDSALLVVAATKKVIQNSSMPPVQGQKTPFQSYSEQLNDNMKKLAN